MQLRSESVDARLIVIRSSCTLIQKMESVRNLALCLVVLGFLLVSAKADETSEQHTVSAHKAVKKQFLAWVARHQAKYNSNLQNIDGLEAIDITILAAAIPTCMRKVGKKAHFKTVKDAVSSIPDGNQQRCIINIAAGVYKEKIVVPKSKPYITFQGAGMKTTILHWGDTAKSAGSTSRSASTVIESDFFIAQDIAFANTAPAPAGGAVKKQAVAFRINGDKAQFYRVAFYGAQDTLYDHHGRHYFKNCYIQGSIDFIFGDGQSYYEDCHLNSIAKSGSGSLTAQKRGSKSDLGGFSFVGCRVTGTGPIYLGRAWGPYSRVVFLKTEIDALIIPAGWYDWGVSSRRKTVFYGQYLCTGPGAVSKARVKWSYALSRDQAAPFLTTSFIDGRSWIGKV